MSSDAQPDLGLGDTASATDAQPVETNIDPSSSDTNVTTLDEPPTPPPDPGPYVKLVFENLIEDDREPCAGNFALSVIYDKALQLTRRGGYPSVHHRILANAAEQLFEVIPSSSYTAAEKKAYMTHDKSIWMTISCGKNSSPLIYRNCDTALYRFLSKQKLSNGTEVVLTIFHPGLPNLLSYHGKAADPVPPPPIVAPAPVLPVAPPAVDVSHAANSTAPGDPDPVPSDPDPVQSNDVSAATNPAAPNPPVDNTN
jgi:hypothetical protein